MNEFYGTLQGANDYFLGSLYSAPWDNANITERQKALITATRSIDRLNFYSQKATSEQALEFPRSIDPLAIPADIEQATYELASSFLDGVDPHLEFENLSLQSQSFSGTKTTYRDASNMHIIAGIPSRSSWNFLKPYLRDDQRINLLRT